MSASSGKGNVPTLTFLSEEFTVSPPAKHRPPREGNAPPTSDQTVSATLNSQSGKGSLPSVFIPKKSWGRAVKKAALVLMKSGGNSESGKGSTCVGGQCYWEPMSKVGEGVGNGNYNDNDNGDGKRNEGRNSALTATSSFEDHINDIKTAAAQAKQTKTMSIFANRAKKTACKITGRLMKSAQFHVNSMFENLQKKKMLTSRVNGGGVYSATKTFKQLDISSVFPSVSLRNLGSDEFSSVFDMCSGYQLAVLEFYVSKTRSAEPVIAIDP
ncbi:hypothetical protein TL16_g03364 [Triparma laevis f. inornata]|uniref:Uncharacterized protein n=2 Tax=Triparma laevis TaxID=1534972 RepID=A0A9W7FMW5_9STRA|nr:hypothetical protein TL16_g03364 [Triparma laevis f. inornata]GMI15087.1 hypothetical protein TrLO_g4143 [Triparma laevis f. longispina]